jgi:MFS family permease
MSQESGPPSPRGPRRLRIPLALGAIALIPVAVLFSLGGPFTHLAGVLLWLLLILGPLTHILLRRRQSEHLDQSEEKNAEPSCGAHACEPTIQRQLEPPKTKTSMWGPLRNPIFRSLWVASLVSGSAVSAQDTALRWVMNGLSASSLLLSAISTLTFLAFCLVTFPAGMATDRFDRRRVLKIINLLLAAASGLLTIFAFLHRITPPIILVFAFVLACGLAASAPAWSALMPEVVEEKYWPAVAALGGVQLNLSGIVGSAIGGFLVLILGTSVVFGLAAAGFLYLSWTIRASQSFESRSPAEARKSWSVLFRELIYVLTSQRAIQVVIARNVLFSLFISVIPTLLPVIGLKILRMDSASLGLLYTSLGIGAVVGGFWIVPLVKTRLASNDVTIFASAILGLTYFLMGCIRDTRLFMLVAGVGGAAWTLAAAELWAAGLYSTTAKLRGRVNAMLMVVSNGGLAAGSFLWGTMPDRYGIDATLHAASIALLCSLPLLFWLSIDFKGARGGSESDPSS